MSPRDQTPTSGTEPASPGSCCRGRAVFAEPAGRHITGVAGRTVAVNGGVTDRKATRNFQQILGRLPVAGAARIVAVKPRGMTRWIGRNAGATVCPREHHFHVLAGVDGAGLRVSADATALFHVAHIANRVAGGDRRTRAFHATGNFQMVRGRLKFADAGRCVAVKPGPD